MFFCSTLIYPNGVRVEYGYDGGNRLTSITHRVVLTNAVLISYTAVYDNGDRLTQITESPSGDVTSFGYDNADNLLSETRTGTKPYSGAYTYDKTNRRKTAVVVTNGVTTHNGTYYYDGAGRLTQVIDIATNTTEVYTWNDDGTLATSPGSGYTKVYGYDEEKHLTSIGHNVAGTVTTLYQYGYGADGNRRWRKDLAGNVWTWFPCGVACSAGELVEQTSDLTGTTWATSGLYLRAGGGCSSQLIRRNSEYHHADLLNGYGVITNGTGTVLSNRLYDAFSVQRYSSGSAVSALRFDGVKTDVDNLVVDDTCYAILDRDLDITDECQMNPLKKAKLLLCAGCVLAISIAWLREFKPCGNPAKNPTWAQCIIDHWNQLVAACKSDKKCAGILNGCKKACLGGVKPPVIRKGGKRIGRHKLPT